MSEFNFTENEIKEGNNLFKKEVKFTFGVPKLDILPDMEAPEIALAGRSNVGKSSLINLICNRKSLARTSNTPGRTRELNYFEVSDGRFNLVDMPGYGYAKMSKSDAVFMNRVVRAYLQGRVNLRRVFLLIDVRHGIKKNDEEILEMLNIYGVSYNIVLTKCDKIGKEKVQRVKQSILERTKKMAAASPEVICTSVLKREGIEDIRALIYRAVNY